MSNTQTAVAIREDMSLQQLGDILAKSGYFKDSQQAGQAIVKVLAGRELGFGPIASMTGINIIQGKIGVGANLMAAAIRRSERYDYRVVTMTDKLCEIEFFEIVNGKRESIGKSTFTAEDAAKAGTQNMNKFPRNMLFARAISNGFRWFCADLSGGPVYTPEELGATVNEDGEIIDAQPVKPAPATTVYVNGVQQNVPPAPATWAGKVAALDASDTHREALKTIYGDLFAIVTAASENVPPYAAPPANRGEALARCRDMAPIADKAQEAAQ